MKYKTVYSIGDCSEEDLYIHKDDYGTEPDDEFTFPTLAAAKKHCLERLERKIAELEKVRTQIRKSKG